MRRATELGLVLLALGWCGTASAQAYQCRIPERVSLPKIATDKPRMMPVAGYTLALSWSPEFCRRHDGEARHRRQCGGKAGRFGLIVHGLWPEGARSWPQYCQVRHPLTVAEVAPNLCLSPSESLVVKQWTKHGSCMTRRPATYFKVTRILWSGLRIPDLDRISREDGLTAGTIRTRFSDANGGWFPQAIGVRLNERGWLEELQLCYDKRFMPTACDRRRYGAGDAAPAKIWRGL